MTSNLNNIEYNFELDKEVMEDSFPASDVQWIYLNDINNGNYANNFINFSNINLLGASSDKYMDFSQAYVQIPITVLLASNDAFFGYGLTDANPSTITATNENACAVGMKPFHHIIDYASIKVGGTPINRNSQWNNFYINEQLKKMNTDEYKIIGEILNYSIDSGESLTTATAVAGAYAAIIEQNNNLKKPTGVLAGTTPASYRNQGHYDRILRLNQDIQNGNLKVSGTNLANISSSYQSGYLGVYDGTVNIGGKSFISAAATPRVLQWTYNCIVPLCKVHDFFAKVPSINSTQGFELRLQTNVGSPNQNYWTNTFSSPVMAIGNSFIQGTAAATSLTGFTCNATQSFGHTCPFMISPPNVSGTTITNAGTGLAVWPINTTAAANITLTVASIIGYNNPSNGTPQQPCRLWVPMITYNPSYTNEIMRNNIFKMLYNDYYIDTITGITQGSSVSRLYSIQISRPRTIYIIPFLSTSSAGAGVLTTPCPPYQMLTSSAPTTCSNVKLKNFNFQIGGSNIFVNPLQYNSDYYENNLLPLLGKHIANGNSLKSELFSGMIKKRDWETAYGVYAFNICKSTDYESDNMMKNFQINFTLESTATASPYVYDFLWILDYQNELYIDRITGTITSEK